MSVKDDQREWLRAKIVQHGRGTRIRLSEYLKVKPDQITRMLNVEDGKESREIKAHEWVKIVEFFNLMEGRLGISEISPGEPEPGAIEKRYLDLPPKFRLAFEAQLAALEQLASATPSADPLAKDDPE